MYTFIKLGGSLITDKNTPYKIREDVIYRLVKEIKLSLDQNPSLQLILGHGSGSFGHTAASKFNTRDGVFTKNEWEGFVEVKRQVNSLNEIIMKALWNERIEAISFHPSSFIISRKREPVEVQAKSIQTAIDNDIMPVIFGDVIFDLEIGGTIFSTEEVLLSLTPYLDISKILIAGIEKGVWRDKKEPENIYVVLTRSDFQNSGTLISSSGSVDVTGGMKSKVRYLFQILEKKPDIDISIFSGLVKNNLTLALCGKELGTSIKN